MKPQRLNAIIYAAGSLIGLAGGFAAGYQWRGEHVGKLVPTTQIGYVHDYVKNANTWVCVEPNGLVVLSTYAALGGFPEGVYSICVSTVSEPDGRDLNITTALKSVGARFEERE